MALDEWQAAETEDDKARASARVIALAPPGILRNIILRLDELEASLPPDEKPIDWREVIRLERLAMKRALAKPRCQKCGNPMVLGQSETHYTCRESWQR